MLYEMKNPHGGDVYEGNILLDYSANINPLGTPDGVTDALHQALRRIRQYPDPYCRELVKAISVFEEVPGEYILCGNGAAELIYVYCSTVRPKRALEVVPTFSEYSLGLEQAGSQIERYLLRQEDQFELKETFLEYLLQVQPEVLFLCNPNNPTGRLISEDLLEKLLQLCRQRNIRLFLDECFLDLSEGGVSMKPYLEQIPQLFILKAFTKSYGMAGVRLGYGLCADKKLLGEISVAMQPWNVSLLAQEAGVAALQETDFLQKSREVIRTERQWLKCKLEELGFWVCPSQANYLFFCGKPGLDEALRRRGIAIRNCENYRGLTSGWYRIAVRLHEENEQLITEMKQVCKEEIWQERS